MDFLISKLPAPTEDDLSKGILESIDMHSYRAEEEGRDEDGWKPEPEVDRLSNILEISTTSLGAYVGVTATVSTG